MTLDLALIGSVAGQEAAKQQTDLKGFVRLLEAYLWAYTNRYETLNKHWLQSVAEKVDRTANYGGYRKTPVTFANVGSSANPQLIPELVDAHCRNRKSIPIERWVNELLWIHPWRDGNGRVAWIVRTRLTDTWASPDPLPNYFGE